MVVALAAGCASTHPVSGYWVREHDAADPSPVWMHFYDDGTCEMHVPGETYFGTYTSEHDEIVIRANHQARCTLGQGQLQCVGVDGKVVAFVRRR